VALASRQNPDLHSSESSLQAANYDAKAAWSGFFPQISGTVDYTHGNSFSISQSSGGSPSGGNAGNSVLASLNATQNLFAGFADKGKVDQAKANRAASRANLHTTRAKVGFDLKSAFANLHYAQDFLKLTADFIKRRQENLNIVQLRFESGEENKGSYLLSKANLEQAFFDNLTAKQNIEVAQQQLAKVLGVDDALSLHITGDVPMTDPKPPPDYGEAALITPNHAQAVAQQKVSKADITLARSGYFPNLDVTGSVSDQKSDLFSNSGRWSAGVNLFIPFFSGGKDYYGTKSAEANFLASTYNRESVDRQILASLRQTYTLYVQAVERLKVDLSFADAAQVRSEIARNKYNNGLLSFEDWDIIENDLITKQKTVLQDARDRVIAEATWEETQGKGAIP
jgi:outer membrane protein TolC